MNSPQVLRGRRVSATLITDGVQLTSSREITDIPLAAMQEVRTVGHRTVEIVLTDGVTHRVEGANPTATAAFTTALTAALPEQRAAEGSALVTTNVAPGSDILWGRLALVSAVPLAYVGYAVWVGATHGVRVLGVALGVVPLVIGLAMFFTAAHDVFRRTILRQRGITVPALAVGKADKKRTVYAYTDLDGIEREYRCTRATPGIHLTYDPRKPERAAHQVWLVGLLVRLFLLFVGSLPFLFLGVTMAFSLFWQ